MPQRVSPGVLGSLFLPWVLSSAVGCADDEVLPPNSAPDGGEPLELVSGPELVLDPNGTTPLAARLTVATNLPSTVEVEVEGAGGEAWTISFSGAAADHALPILGFEADQSYTLSVTLTGPNGGALALEEPLSLSTDPLPDEFPEIAVESAAPDRMEPGFTLFDATGSKSYAVILDAEGDVVWLQGKSRNFGDIRQLPNGHLFVNSAHDAIEMDLLGNELRRYRSSASGDVPEGIIPVLDTGRGFHHEVFPTSRDTVLTLGYEITTIDDFHTSYDDPNATDTVELTDDRIIEFDAEGNVLRRWAVRDLLDTSRIGYDSLSSHFALGTDNDWAHCNAVIEAGPDGAIVSCRHQDAVFKFSLEDGQIDWILANHENWSTAFEPYLLTPEGSPFEWPYHQHAPMITPEGTVLLFDNGNHRASPYDGTTPVPDTDNYSRAVEYRIDEEEMTIEQVWEYGSSIDPQLYTFFISDADYMPETGSVLVTFGGLRRIGDQTNADLGRGQYQSRLVEVERGASDAVVFEVAIYGDASEAPAGWRTYRSERIPSLYGEGVTSTR